MINMAKYTLNELVEILEGKLVDIFINNGISYLSMKDVDIDNVSYCDIDNTYTFKLNGTELNILASIEFIEEEKNIFRFESDSHLIVISK
jgi:hypothetical protein